MSKNSNKKNVVAQGAPSSQDTTTNSQSAQAPVVDAVESTTDHVVEEPTAEIPAEPVAATTDAPADVVADAPADAPVADAAADAAKAEAPAKEEPKFVKLDPSQMGTYSNRPLLARYMNEAQLKAAGLDRDPKTGLPINRYFAGGKKPVKNAMVVAIGPDKGKDITHLVPSKGMIEKPNNEDGWYGISTCTHMDSANPVNNRYGLSMVVPAEDRTKGYKFTALTESRYGNWREKFVDTLEPNERDAYYGVITAPNIRNTNNHAAAKAEVVVDFESKAVVMARKAEAAAKAEADAKVEATKADAEPVATEQTVELQ